MTKDENVWPYALREARRRPLNVGLIPLLEQHRDDDAIRRFAIGKLEYSRRPDGSRGDGKSKEKIVWKYTSERGETTSYSNRKGFEQALLMLLKRFQAAGLDLAKSQVLQFEQEQKERHEEQRMRLQVESARRDAKHDNLQWKKVEREILEEEVLNRELDRLAMRASPGVVKNAKLKTCIARFEMQTGSPSACGAAQLGTRTSPSPSRSPFAASERSPTAASEHSPQRKICSPRMKYHSASGLHTHASVK